MAQIQTQTRSTRTAPPMAGRNFRIGAQAQAQPQRRKPGRPRKEDAEEPAPSTRGRQATAEVEEAPPPLSKRVARRIEDVRAPFRTHVTAFGHMDEKAQDIAPDYMAAFAAWRAETEGNFVTFVRLFDDTVPANRDPDPADKNNQGYKNHRTYRAADYLRRLAPLVEEGEEGREEREGPTSVSDAFVRLLAAIVALIPGNQVEKLWEVIGKELHWSERRVTTLRESVQDVEPLVEAHVEQRQVVVEEPR